MPLGTSTGSESLRSVNCGEPNINGAQRRPVSLSRLFQVILPSPLAVGPEYNIRPIPAFAGC